MKYVKMLAFDHNFYEETENFCQKICVGGRAFDKKIQWLGSQLGKGGGEGKG